MNDKFSQLDDAMLDRLVDGELPVDERRRVLASLDAQPDGWRRCALAFVEAQSWGNALQSLATAAPRQGAVKASTAIASSAHSVRRFSAETLIALAASIALAFGLGWGLRGHGARPPAPHSQVASVVPDGPPAADSDAVTLLVHDAAGQPQRVRVPLVEGSQLGAPFAAASSVTVPIGLRQQLGERGLDLTARRRYAPMFFEQHDRVVPMVVPVDDAVITPVNRDVY